MELVWSTSHRLTLIFVLLTLVAGVLPAAVAWIGQLIVDGVVAAMNQYQQTSSADTTMVLLFVVAEAGVVALIAASQRGISTCQALLRALMPRPAGSLNQTFEPCDTNLRPRAEQHLSDQLRVLAGAVFSLDGFDPGGRRHS
jgi:GAF domain-containing protein